MLLPGDSANSRLIHLVAAIEPDEAMPPDGTRLSPAEVGLLRAWIDQGANWPDGADVLDPRAERAKSHWAFQPLRADPGTAGVRFEMVPDADRPFHSRRTRIGRHPASASSRSPGN